MANPVTLAAEPSAWEKFQTSVVDGANWVGRNLKAFGNAIADYAVKVWEYVKPFFAQVGQFMADKYQQAKEWLSQNKDVAIPVAGAIALTVIVYALFTSLFDYSGNPGETKKSEENKDAKKA